MNADYNNSEIPADLQDIARGMDALGAAERASAPAGLEGRVHAASAAALAPKLRLTDAEPLEVVVRPMKFTSRRWLTPLRMAAAVAFVSTVGVAYLAINGRGPVQTNIAQIETGNAIADMEHWLTLATPDESVAAELDLLIADTERVREGMHTAPPADGGAM